MATNEQLRALVRERGNIAAMARESGVERTRLHHWLGGRPGYMLRLDEAERVAAACGKRLRLTR